MHRAKLLLTVAMLATVPARLASADDAATARPATPAEAAKALDLADFPLMPGAKPPGTRRLANLHYEANGGPRDAYAFQKTTLEARGWKELSGGYQGDSSCIGAFGKDGFTVSVTTSPAYGAGAAGRVNVMLIQHGNVDLARLPVPAAKLMYTFPATTAYVTEAPVKETAEAVRRILTERGWQPYGTAGDSQDFKQNAVKLSVMTSSAPAQGGKTMIQLTSELLSVDLPAPPNPLRAAYADTTKALSIDVAMTPAELATFYRDALGKAGWKATTDAPFKSDFRQMLVFRNDAKEILTLAMHTIDGKTRANLDHQTAAEFEDAMNRAQAADAKRKADSAMYAKKSAEEAERKVVKVTIAVPAGAKDVERGRGDLRFKLAPGTARAAVEAIRTDLVRQGWKPSTAALEQLAGSVVFSKAANVKLTVVYVDTGFDDASVNVSAFGARIVEPPSK